jgi:crotonobetainyl-CoA:carnitine CoA-transferase CaiB-like acyl-CoA transferase
VTTAGGLSGIKVLDLSRVLAGPLCTMTLGDMGAEVIKVEPPQGDDTRAWAPPQAGGEAAYFLGVNRNKRSLRLDLSQPKGREILGRLIERADILVENYKPGTLQRWGFTKEWIEDHAPRLIHCTITGYGEVGPKSSLPGYDFVLQAEGGLMSITGPADGEPTKVGVAVVDIATGLYATIGILGALQTRQVSGRGQKVSTSLFETSLSLLANVASNYLVGGTKPGRYGNGHPNIVPYTTFATADGVLALAVGNDNQFSRFAQLAGHPEWATDPRFEKNASRVQNRGEIETLIAKALRERATSVWIELLRGAGIPCGAVNDAPAALEDPHTVAAGMVTSVAHPTVGELRMLRFPVTMSASPFAVNYPPPLLGEHSSEVLAEELGLNEAAIAELKKANII